MPFGFGLGSVQRRVPDPAGFACRVAGVLALLVCWAASPASAQSTDTLVSILNRAEVGYRTPNGLDGRSVDEALVVLRRSPRVTLSADEAAQLCGGTSHVFTHRVTNAGNGLDWIRIETDAPAGARVSAYLDRDGDGVPSPADEELTGPIVLEPGASAVVLLRVEVDPDASGVQYDVVVRARSAHHPDAVATVTDRLGVCVREAVLHLSQTVDRDTATVGDTLQYALVLENRGNKTSVASMIVDTLVAKVRYVHGSLRVDGVEVYDTLAYTLERLDDGKAVLRIPQDTLRPGERRAIDFRVEVVADTATAAIVNQPHLEAGEQVVRANAVTTRVRFPSIALEVRVVDSRTVLVGDRITFELRYRNNSTVRAPNAVLTDVLPAELEYVGADPQPSEVSSDGQPMVEPSMASARGGSDVRSVSWNLGTLEPGAEGSVLFYAHVIRAPVGGTELVNVASLSAGTTGFSVVVAAVVAPVTAVSPADVTIGITKTAGRLEVGLGEPVPYALVVENTGIIPLDDLVVRDWVPEGMTPVLDGVEGADSVRVAGGELRFYLPGSIAPAETRTIRYAAIPTQARGRAIANRAVAEALGGRIVSDTAAAWVRVRSGPSVPARTIVGKVWVDENRNGRQDPGEPGVGGVDVWTTDGLVVRTDEHGRFSLRNVEAGRYTLRLDPIGLADDLEFAEPGGDLQEVRMDGWTSGRADFRLIRRRRVVNDHAGPPPVALMQDDGGTSLGRVAVDASVALPPSPGVVRVASLRTVEDRTAEERRVLIAGPSVRITEPGDGAVVSSGRIYVGVRGEAGRMVRLYDHDDLIGEATIRPDGVADFVGVDLAPGPHRLRVQMANSWGHERWDSVTVHRSGSPAAFEVESAPRPLRAESPELETIRVRVLDEWGVPLVSAPLVSVAARGVALVGEDADPSSVGVQLRVDESGWLEVVVRAGDEVGRGEITLRASGAEHVVALEVLPPVRPLFATMSGRIGIGASDRSFAAITARGALDERTSITISYDSRRSTDAEDFFARGYDPLDDAVYPTTGDGSSQRVLSSATEKFTVRVERGLDWFAFGDVRSEGFSNGGQLTRYDRALSGVSSRVATGPVVWHAFGSATRQVLDEIQLRGDGSSGPYRLGVRIRPGTERLAIEVRASDNAARVLSRTELRRFVDYQIDYESGEVLLDRLVPASDPHGNPVFLVATIERLDAAENHWVGGVRMEFDAARAFGLRGVDSLGVVLMGVHDGADDALPSTVGGESTDLVGAEVLFRVGESQVGLEFLHSSGDSTGLAGRASVAWAPWQDRALLRAEWMSVGDGFASRQNPRLRSDLDELKVGGDLVLTPELRLQLDHERQRFGGYGIERNSSRARLVHTRAERVFSLESGLVGEASGTASIRSLLTRASMELSSDFSVWAEGRHALDETGDAAGDQVAAGVSVRLLPWARLEGLHRQTLGDSPWAISSLMLSLDPWTGGRLWGGLDRMDGDRRVDGVSVGLDQRIALPAGWALNAQLERRMGLDQAPLTDLLRSLPFPQQEYDRFSAGLGLQWRGQNDQRTLEVRGEYTDGELSSGYRFVAAGDLKVGDDVALLTRHDWLLTDHTGPSVNGTDRRDRSLLGVAFRPTHSTEWNALAKIEWRRTMVPEDPTRSIPGGDAARLIGAADLVWTPAPTAEVAIRYALRHTTDTGGAFGGQSIRGEAHFVGSTFERAIVGRFDGRLDGRLLLEQTTGTSRWSIAPTLVTRLTNEFELELGYRFGDLVDLDFAGNGGLGFFASIGVRLTERNATDVLSFWRQRIADRR